ncbi:class I SAM-dependent methyltransferase [uncultured Cohaesibacter sp.]|uniref:class I SAM-dependent DNA methyltransferase n=1 Tax=uncultured Cohaesibacter sp. TaxID=1002546 RepID=UPI00292FB12A|nr:class I SAM-dependent methyltransferase [uncultured Cohaesibacter sp.]
MGNRTEMHERVLSAESTDALMGAYQEWAADYDKHLLKEWGYLSPNSVASLLAIFLEQKDAAILDAGCGTGLVGECLSEQKFSNIEGADYSKDMLKEAEKKQIYKALHQIDLNDTVPFEDGQFDAVTCVGTFTTSHVKPEALNELIRITRKGGLICMTVRDSYWDETRFSRFLLDLDAEGKILLQEMRTELMIVSEGSCCKVLLIEVI